MIKRLKSTWLSVDALQIIAAWNSKKKIFASADEKKDPPEEIFYSFGKIDTIKIKERNIFDVMNCRKMERKNLK